MVTQNVESVKWKIPVAQYRWGCWLQHRGVYSFALSDQWNQCSIAEDKTCVKLQYLIPIKIWRKRSKLHDRSGGLNNFLSTKSFDGYAKLRDSSGRLGHRYRLILLGLVKKEKCNCGPHLTCEAWRYVPSHNDLYFIGKKSSSCACNKYTFKINIKIRIITVCFKCRKMQAVNTSIRGV